ncbi:hypothetical protein HOP50_17g80550 [Chloropicon primus]|uniref:Glycoside hydrolase n=1 Tax=Chloropicon primus TaxID=1764295 RepID=A0A5B8MY49_9CHLO|nr:hypothetical protein A3770_17p80310 [Chloropicon primus]UPR04710.1 hypothetical protein HOP50_17g80550 [Chloropicon primus]|eukprot:QDZ25513.1 hypothetical protein A3770_17p80310 [Chloropicon primus]
MKSLALFLSYAVLLSSVARAAEVVSFNLGAKNRPNVQAVHGISQGPKFEKGWDSHMPDGRNRAAKDWTSGFKRAAVPSVRVHGMGCVDMDHLWRPSTYAGFDPKDTSNYDWTISDECLRNVYDNPSLSDLKSASIRFGHSRAKVADYPSFCQGPDDVDIFAEVCVAIIDRYLNVKGYPVRDFSVWNEPSGGIEHSDYAFYCKGPDDYAAMYIAVWNKAKAKFGNRIRIGAALGLDDFSRTVVAQLKASNVGMDFVDHHSYPNTPSAIPYQVHVKPGGYNMEDIMAEGGFSKTTPIILGEWSRSIGLNYALDGPGASFIAASLIYIDDMGLQRSGGVHNVEQAYLFSSQKVWDGLKPDAPDLNAATVLNWWRDMVGRPAMPSTGGRMPTATTNDELAVLMAGPKAEGKDSNDALALIAHYEADKQKPSRVLPTTGLPFDLQVNLEGIPWQDFKWTQYAKAPKAASLVEVASGKGKGPKVTLGLKMNRNSFSTLRVENAKPSSGGLLGLGLTGIKLKIAIGAAAGVVAILIGVALKCTVFRRPRSAKAGPVPTTLGFFMSELKHEGGEDDESLQTFNPIVQT